VNQNVINAYASKALRVLLLAYRDFEDVQDWSNEDELAQELTVATFVGILVCATATKDTPYLSAFPVVPLTLSEQPLLSFLGPST
jgi:hypothetical protein